MNTKDKIVEIINGLEEWLPDMIADALVDAGLEFKPSINAGWEERMKKLCVNKLEDLPLYHQDVIVAFIHSETSPKSEWAKEENNEKT